jgi:hypothetical protein
MAAQRLGPFFREYKTVQRKPTRGSLKQERTSLSIISRVEKKAIRGKYHTS